MKAWLDASTVIQVLGLVLIFAGLALVSIPAALVTVGALLFGLALLVDLLQMRRGGG